MTIKPTHHFMPCVPGAFQGGLSRTAFFDGMVLSEADMLREQSYWRMKRRLTNRALGQGVVWGLTLKWEEDKRCLTLSPGYGLSCCGDDLIVECPETVRERDLIDPCSEEFRCLFADEDDPSKCSPESDEPTDACLLLEYAECPEDPRQVYEDPCAEEPKGCRFGALRETTRLRLVPQPQAEPADLLEWLKNKIGQIETMSTNLGKPDYELPDDFHYKGPRCENKYHGIILGCVLVSAEGKIQKFDQNTHRRYVLTGPLISHWSEHSDGNA